MAFSLTVSLGQCLRDRLCNFTHYRESKQHCRSYHIKWWLMCLSVSLMTCDINYWHPRIPGAPSCVLFSFASLNNFVSTLNARVSFIYASRIRFQCFAVATEFWSLGLVPVRRVLSTLTRISFIYNDSSLFSLHVSQTKHMLERRPLNWTSYTENTSVITDGNMKLKFSFWV